MKKTAVLIVTVILSVFCSVPVFAAGNDLPEEQTIGVFAKAVYTLPDGSYGAEEDDDGDYIVELPDGTEITLIPKSANPSLRIVIVPITEQDEQAYQWISRCATNLGTNPLFYDIYFIDEYGTRVDVNMTLEVSVALMSGYGVSKAAEISADGKVSQLVSKSGGNIVSFTIEKGGYYAFASARIGDTDAPISPQTGDNSMMNLGIALLFVSCVGVAGTTLYGRKKSSKISANGKGGCYPVNSII